MTDAFYLNREQLEDSRDLINSILEVAVDASLIINRDFKVTFISGGFTELTGQSSADFAGHDVRELKIGNIGPIEEVLKRGTRQMAVPMTIGSRKLLANLLPVISGDEVTGVAVLVLFRSMTVLKRAIASIDRDEAGEDIYSTLSRKTSSYSFSDFVGDSPNIITTIEQCHRISHSHHPVLLIGETGVGKEIIASGIFAEYSGGRSMPFVKINCSAIPKDLLESELFGHEKGAFTGANSTKKGKFELAAGGVLLLDEIGEMDLGLQSKLLRVVEEKEFERIGGNRVIPLNARIIASTNQNLKEMAVNGSFRLDLYYRLNTFEISIPPLRAHKQDIPALIRHFSQLDRLSLEFSSDAMGMIMEYDWPGNVRELRNVLNRLHFLYPNTLIDAAHIYNATGEMFALVNLPKYRNQDDPLPPPVRNLKAASSSAAAEAGAAGEAPAAARRGGSLREREKQIIQEVLEEVDFNLSKAAASLEISRSTLYDKIKKYGIRAARA